MSKTFDRKDVYSVLNAEDASQYVGTKGYFADTLSCLNEKVRKNMLDPLDDVNQLHDFPFISYVTGFLFFLPADKVKEVEEEKKWRAFKDIEEFKKETGLGLLSIVRYRYIIEKPKVRTKHGDKE